MMGLDAKWVAALIVLVSGILGFFKAMGAAEGASKERKKQATRNEKFEGRLADAEEEAEFNKPLADRLRDARGRISRRRDGDVSE
jgi:hypothetical protein